MAGPANQEGNGKPRKRKEPPTTAHPPTRKQRTDDKSKGDDHIQDTPLSADGYPDLQTFVNKLETEIKNLEQSRLKSSNKDRAFQRLPRHMRRRTASHNPKRVPRRLRARATREHIQDKTPTITARRRKPRTTTARIRAETAKRLGILAEKRRKRKVKEAKAKQKQGTDAVGDTPTHAKLQSRLARPKIRRNQLNEPQKPKPKFRKRQVNKTWLATHVWHAKRARMTEPKSPLWRFAIPLKPNDKVFRSTHRATVDKGTAVWDMSYMSTIGLHGSASGIERVLRSLGVGLDRCWNEKGLRWRMGLRHWTGWLSREQRGLRRMICPATIFWNPEPSGREHAEDDTTMATTSQRQVFIRVHPSAFLELFDEMLKRAKMQTPRLYIEDLRYEVGSLQLIGPASTETLLGILKPYHGLHEDLREQHADIFESLAGITNPTSLPSNSLLSFSILDPRLRSPPKTFAFPENGDKDAETKMLENLVQWPVEKNLKPYGLFDRNCRFTASLLPSQKSLSRRRSDKEADGYINKTPADPPIPIILLASRSSLETKGQGTWTVLAPWKCILPIWTNLVHYPLYSGRQPTFGGLDELRQVEFERSMACFPFDCVGTDAGAEWEQEQRAKRKADWEKRPKNKRVEWKSVNLGAGRKGEIGAGWSCDFEYLFGVSGVDADKRDSPGPATGDAMVLDKEAPAREVEAQSLKSLNLVSKELFLSQLSKSGDLETFPPYPILNVKITLLSKGAVSTCARIYRLPAETTREPLPSTDAEVPATQPAHARGDGNIPRDLREQWLACVPGKPVAKERTKRPPPSADMQSRKRHLAEALFSTVLEYPPPRPNQTDIGGHPLVPDAKDLIGFVTTGSYNLRAGKAMAIGNISAEKAIKTVLSSQRGEGYLCIVRNAGENIGWIARWEAL
jgi:ribonuclease P/MRP protein subunit POP1